MKVSCESVLLGVSQARMSDVFFEMLRKSALLFWWAVEDVQGTTWLLCFKLPGIFFGKLEIVWQNDILWYRDTIRYMLLRSDISQYRHRLDDVSGNFVI